MMRRLSVAVVVLLVSSVLLDPYTFRQTASDIIVGAPAWQMAVGPIPLDCARE